MNPFMNLTIQRVAETRYLLHICDGHEFRIDLYVLRASGQYTPSGKPKYTLELCKIFDFPLMSGSMVVLANWLVVISNDGENVLRSTSETRLLTRMNQPPLIVVVRYHRFFSSLDNIRQQARIIHIIPSSFFVSFKDPNPHGYKALSWEAWGQDNSRCFIDSEPGQPGVCGYQVVLTPNYILDFNPLHIRREMHLTRLVSEQDLSSRVLTAQDSEASEAVVDASVASTEGSSFIVRSPTVYEQKVFKGRVVSKLPYRIISTSQPTWTGPTPHLIFAGEIPIVCTKDSEVSLSRLSWFITCSNIHNAFRSQDGIDKYYTLSTT